MVVRAMEASLGALFIVIGLFARKFKWGGPGVGGGSSARPFPMTLGKLIFIIAGVYFLYLGVSGTR